MRNMEMPDEFPVLPFKKIHNIKKHQRINKTTLRYYKKTNKKSVFAVIIGVTMYVSREQRMK